MLEAHAPHEAIQTWRGFFIHIATIVLGLIIAVGLEQTVEFFHHRHQRLELERQLREVLEDDTRVVAADTATLATFRAYLVDLQVAVDARRRGKTLPPVRPASERNSNRLTLPSLAPYEAAKDNGTIALLSTQQLRLFNRVALQRDLLKGVYANWFDDLAAIGAFKRRFDYAATGSGDLQVDLDVLSPGEVTEYQALIGTLMSRVDWLGLRLGIFGDQCRAILDGARDEKDLTRQ